MRDILLTVIIAGLLPAILFWPSLGAYAWAWVSLMNPHRGAWGFAATIPFAQLVAIATLVGALFTRKRHPFPISPITMVYLSFLVWMSLTSLFALNTPQIVFESWIFVVKVHTMMLVVLLLLRGRQQIEMLIWTVTLSIGFYGVKGGVFTVATGGSFRVWGPPGSMIEGNNELGVALITLIPLMIYLLRISRSKAVRWLMFFSTLATAAAILGSHSRGALLALAAMSLVLGLKGKRPVLSTVVLACVLAGGAALMPDRWSSRMETIETYEHDGSAMSRLYTWKTLWALAIDRPITGGGFAIATDAIYSRYAPPIENPTPGLAQAPHSIYFQALGEHGFPGLALYLLLGVLTWRTAGRLAKDTRDDAEFGPWVPMLMKSVQISMAGFAVGGAFLTLVHFDLQYYFVALVVLVDATVRDAARTKLSAGRETIQAAMKVAHR